MGIRAIPMVSIADSGAIATLQSQGAPYRVSCELPTQLAFLSSSHGRQHEQVRLLLDPTSATDDELDTALVEAMLRLGQCTSLSVHYNGKATPATLNAICKRLSLLPQPPASLELSFKGARTDQLLPGMAQLMSQQPGLALALKGSLATSAAIYCLRRFKLEYLKLEELKLIGLDADDEPLLECLAGLGQTSLRIDLQFDDTSDPDTFIDALLAAGVWAGRQLRCHTADGRSASLQERLDACRDTHLNRLLMQCTQEGRLHRQQLLNRCQAIHGGGAQLYGWACEIEAEADTASEDLPEVPITLKGYWRTLTHSQVAHTVCCEAPNDVQALTDLEVARITSLRLDFGEMLDTDPALQAIGNALRRMQKLKACSFHHRRASAPFGDWLFSHLVGLPIERACFDLGGEKRGTTHAMAVSFLSKSTLKVVTCLDMLSVSLLTIALGRFPNPLPWALKLNVPPEHEADLANTLAISGTKSGLHLSVHFPADHHPSVLMATLHGELSKRQPAFQVKWLDISSLSYTMPLDNPLALRVAWHRIQAMSVETRHSPAGSNITSLVKTFATSIGSGIVDADLTDPELARIKTAAKYLGDPMATGMDVFLDPIDLVMLSSVNWAARRHAVDFAFPRRQKVTAWLRSMADMRWPLEHYRTILLAVFKRLSPAAVDDDFLQECLHPADPKSDRPAAPQTSSARRD